MERTKRNMQVNTELSRRKLLARRLGVQYEGNRNVYDALGYPADIQYQDYMGKYLRMDVAGAVINRPIEDTWRGAIEVQGIGAEGTKPEEMPLTKAYNELYYTLKMKSAFIRLDKLSSLGRYAIMLVGFSDVAIPEDFQKPVQKTNALRVLYITPYGEDCATISTFDTNPASPRFGLPSIYQVKITTPSGIATTVMVHYSRVIHVTGETIESEVFGIPVLQRVYNRLMDLEKLVGGSAEMFWRGAKPGSRVAVKEGFSSPDPTKLKQDLDEQIQEYENGLSQILLTEGLEFSDFQYQLSDPSPSVDVQLTMISIVTGIPKRILQGSERGELASTTDADTWYGRVQTRREEYAEPQIIEPLIDLFIRYGILPNSDYEVKWKPLFNPSDKERADIGAVKATTLASYAASPTASSIIPEPLFLKYIMNMNEEQITEIESYIEQTLQDEAQIQLSPEEEEILRQEGLENNRINDKRK